jgi:hypothetical protein
MVRSAIKQIKLFPVLKLDFCKKKKKILDSFHPVRVYVGGRVNISKYLNKRTLPAKVNK